jgi:hypothetical protein
MSSTPDQPSPQQDEAATEPPAGREKSPSDRHEEQQGGPLGNPEVDEEALRLRQEESSERSNDALG